MLPVSFSPSTLNVNVVGVVSPPRPGTSPVHFPLISAAIAMASTKAAQQMILIAVFSVVPFSSGGIRSYASHCTRSRPPTAIEDSESAGDVMDGVL